MKQLTANKTSFSAPMCVFSCSRPVHAGDLRGFPRAHQLIRSSGCSRRRVRQFRCHNSQTCAAIQFPQGKRAAEVKTMWPVMRVSLKPKHVQTRLQALPIDMLPVCGPWNVWLVLLSAAIFGLWAERTKLGKDLSGALITTLAGMFFANVGVLPPHTPEYVVVNKFLLPVAIPLLLFSADLRKVITGTGRLLGAFFVGAFATVVGSVVAMWAMPMESLGREGWKVAAALTARHIGGAVNFVAVSESLTISSSTTGAALAADDLILALYFTVLYGLAKAIPPEPGANTSDTAIPGHGTSYAGKAITVFEGMVAVALSLSICGVAAAIAIAYHLEGQFITIITAITVLMATFFPKKLEPYTRSAEAIAQMLMQVFFATVGASARIAETLRTGPTLFGFSVIAIAVHLALILLVGKLLGYSRQELLLASNANIGGPSTVAGMAAAKGWPSRLVPAVLSSIMGYALGTFTGMVLGVTVLKPLGGTA